MSLAPAATVPVATRRSLTQLLALALCAMPLPAAAQTSAVSNAIRKFAESSGKHVLAAAEAMPADKYAFRPTAAQMRFGELVAHIQRDNRTTCAVISGVSPDSEPKLDAAAPKAVLVSALRRSVTFCTGALARLEDSALGDSVSWYGQRTTRATASIGLLTDWADHYGQQAIYLRLNGVLPPTAR